MGEFLVRQPIWLTEHASMPPLSTPGNVKAMTPAAIDVMFASSPTEDSSHIVLLLLPLELICQGAMDASWGVRPPPRRRMPPDAKFSPAAESPPARDDDHAPQRTPSRKKHSRIDVG